MLTWWKEDPSLPTADVCRPAEGSKDVGMEGCPCAFGSHVHEPVVIINVVPHIPKLIHPVRPEEAACAVGIVVREGSEKDGSINESTALSGDRSTHCVNTNNESICKAQNLVHRDYSKHIHMCMHTHTHTHTHTQAPAHTSILTIQRLIYTA